MLESGLDTCAAMNLTFSEYVLSVVFGIWTVCSVIRQLSRRFGRWVLRFDVFQLLPAWQFFWQDVPDRDIHLMSQDMLANGSITEWVFAIPAYRKSFWAFAWNPERRIRKSIAIQSGHLLKLKAESNSEFGRTARVADRIIRAHIDHRTRLLYGRMRRYGIATSEKFGPAAVEPGFISDFRPAFNPFDRPK